jgi:hypothetical protein
VGEKKKRNIGTTQETLPKKLTGEKILHVGRNIFLKILNKREKKGDIFSLFKKNSPGWFRR